VTDLAPELLVWFNIAALYATGSAADLISAIGFDCPPRPVPWTIWHSRRLRSDSVSRRSMFLMLASSLSWSFSA
jgi:hypothetical protein